MPYEIPGDGADNRWGKRRSSFEGHLRLWEEVIENANLSSSWKIKFKSVVRGRKEIDYDDVSLIDEGIYGRLNQLINLRAEAIAGGANREEVDALVSNLKNDIWAFYKESV